MLENRYRITLFNSRWMETFYTYEYPQLPEVGDGIDIERSVFFVKLRIFPTNYSGNLIEVELHGQMEDDDWQTQNRWDDFKTSLKRSEKRIEIKFRPLDSYNLDYGNSSNDNV